MILTKEDLQVIAQLVADQNKHNTSAQAHKNTSAESSKGGKMKHISNKPTFAAIVKSLAIIVIFAISGGALFYLLSQLAPYI